MAPRQMMVGRVQDQGWESPTLVLHTLIHTLCMKQRVQPRPHAVTTTAELKAGQLLQENWLGRR